MSWETISGTHWLSTKWENKKKEKQSGCLSAGIRGILSFIIDNKSVFILYVNKQNDRQTITYTLYIYVLESDIHTL